MTWNYLRARGEYLSFTYAAQNILELPPRTRRIRKIWPGAQAWYGTTSAHAENTPLRRAPTRAGRNYLRARGEYHMPILIHPIQAELPPRTRRILCPPNYLFIHGGTTSAHAENTAVHSATGSHARNYLRARGEYTFLCAPRWKSGELPPRTRRIPLVDEIVVFGGGTTSAHAENTPLRGPALSARWNYLRARGEY